MKRFLILLGIAVLTISCSDNKEGEGVVDYPAAIPAAGEIPILGWYSIPGSFTSNEEYRQMRDAGFTLSYTNFRGDNNYLQPALDAAQAAGIGIILRCNDLAGSKEARQAVVNRYKDHPALAGWFLEDEPAVDKFDYMATWKRDIVEADPSHPCYANLIPDLGREYFETQMGLRNYSEYLDLYINKLDPSSLSFAYYPIVKGLDGKITLYSDLWFPSLEKVSARSQNEKIPFWTFALSTPHTPLTDPNRPNVSNYDDHFPTPTIEHLRIQMWNNLAYGSQALQYFTYWTPLQDEDIYYWYGGGPKLANGDIGPAYNVVKQMNEEIQKLNGVFNGCTMKWVRHMGETIPHGTQALTDLPAGIRQLSTTEPGATVSLLENQGFTFLVLVSRTLDQDIVVTMEPCSKNVKRVLKDSSISELSGDGKYTIPAGDILIFVLNGPR